MNNGWWANTAVHCVENNGNGLGIGGGVGVGGQLNPSVMDRYLLNNASLALAFGGGKGKGKRKGKIARKFGSWMDKEEMSEENDENGHDDDHDEFDDSEPLKFQRVKSSSSSKNTSNLNLTDFNSSLNFSGYKTNLQSQMLVKMNELEWMVLVMLEHTLTLDTNMYESMRKVVQV